MVRVFSLLFQDSEDFQDSLPFWTFSFLPWLTLSFSLFYYSHLLSILPFSLLHCSSSLLSNSISSFFPLRIFIPNRSSRSGSHILWYLIHSISPQRWSFFGTLTPLVSKSPRKVNLKKNIESSVTSRLITSVWSGDGGPRIVLYLIPIPGGEVEFVICHIMV